MSSCGSGDMIRIMTPYPVVSIALYTIGDASESSGGKQTLEQPHLHRARSVHRGGRQPTDAPMPLAPRRELLGPSRTFESSFRSKSTSAREHVALEEAAFCPNVVLG